MWRRILENHKLYKIVTAIQSLPRCDETFVINLFTISFCPTVLSSLLVKTAESENEMFFC